MGITVHYRGTMRDLDRIEEFEDRLLDVALDLGSSVRIWRSSAKHDSSRVVRGLILDLFPGQETTSLLVAPEGYLIPLVSIEEAENGEITEPPYCSVKTQYGPVAGHVALIELLKYLTREFIPDLQVLDEAGYWEHRDVGALVQEFARMRCIIDTMAKMLNAHPLTSEAAEDPSIVVTRVERIAQQVHAMLQRPPEHAPVEFEEGDFHWRALDESHWDEAYKEQRRKQERLQRATEEQLAKGVDHDEAFENAMRDEGIIDSPLDDDSSDACEDELKDEYDNESWRESLQEEANDDDEDSFESYLAQRHPLQKAASDLHLRIFKLIEHDPPNQSSFLETLIRGIEDVGGGLAQALSSRPVELDGLTRGLALVQLKRALRGVAFARGALYPLCDEAQIDSGVFEELSASLAQIEAGILEELNRIRG